MTLLEGLQSHRGGLLHIKSELFWYGGRGWDGSPGRVCLLLDAGAAATGSRATAAATAGPGGVTAVLLLIDGCPQRVWVCQEDVELIT